MNVFNITKNLLFFAAVGCATFPCFATGQKQTDNRNAINICTPARPIYDAQLRRRPMAIQNEGTYDAFVNCGLSTVTNSYGTEEFSVWFTSYRNTAVTVACTGTVGMDRKPSARQYIVKTAVLPANGYVNIKWTYQADNGGKRWNDNKDSNQVDQNLGFQCVLQPGTSIGDIPTTYRIN